MTMSLFLALYRVQSNRNSSNCGHHRLLVSRRRLAQGEHRNSHPDRLRFHIPRRSVATERRRRLNAWCSPPRARPARLRGNHGRSRRVAVGSGERVARTAKQPQGPARGAFAKQKSQEAAQVRCLQGREIAKGGHVVLRSGVTAFSVYATSPLRA